MWDYYYDEVIWQSKLDSDVYGNDVYGEPIRLNVRLVEGTDELIQDGEKSSIRHIRKYHSPDEIKLGDKIDGVVVKETPIPARDIDGFVYYWEVVVG